MARLQILELPEGGNDDRPPFVLVVDQYVPRRYVQGIGQTAEPVDEFTGVAEQIGARAVLVFEETIDIPANDTSAYLRDDVTVKLGDQPITWSQADETQAQVTETLKPRSDWCCSLAFQTLGEQHIDDCPQGNPQP